MSAYRAPGRVNLIGEHTDYNLGFVLPIALEMACYVERRPASDGYLRVTSENRGERRAWPVSDLAALRPSRDWSDYVVGVAQELIRAGFAIEPAELHVRSDVPEGSGLSSSAALEVSSALALLNGRALAPLELARLCQRAEVTFVGMPCGIMDQYVSVFGREHSALKIDCRSLEHEPVALPEEVEILAVNTMVKHELATSAYKERTQECAEAARLLGVQSLREITTESFRAVEQRLPSLIARRARHVVTENERVEEFVKAAEARDARRMGDLFVASHRSLQHDYEVSCEELDFLVDTALAAEGVYGARMTGGGFGGCTVNLLRRGTGDAFGEAITSAYAKRFGVQPPVYECRPAAGAGPATSF